uniref:Uncharacterized protein n=1 Tax=viral metagenome TaxID=1070528 RepID=A0A6H2A038_9ZZZZ
MSMSKSPFKSKRVWGIAIVIGSILWKLLPLDIQQPLLDTWQYIANRITNEEMFTLLGAAWWVYGQLVSRMPIKWRFWEDQG